MPGQKRFVLSCREYLSCVNNQRSVLLCVFLVMTFLFYVWMDHVVKRQISEMDKTFCSQSVYSQSVEKPQTNLLIARPLVSHNLTFNTTNNSSP